MDSKFPRARWRFLFHEDSEGHTESLRLKISHWGIWRQGMETKSVQFSKCVEFEVWTLVCGLGQDASGYHRIWSAPTYEESLSCQQYQDGRFGMSTSDVNGSKTWNIKIFVKLDIHQLSFRKTAAKEWISLFSVLLCNSRQVIRYCFAFYWSIYFELF